MQLNRHKPVVLRTAHEVIVIPGPGAETLILQPKEIYYEKNHD